MTDLEFKKYREHFRRNIAGLMLPECLSMKDWALTLRQAQLLLDDLQLRIDYLKNGSKSIKKQEKKANTFPKCFFKGE